MKRKEPIWSAVAGADNQVSAKGPGTLDVLQAGRGIAALMVVLFHLNVIFAAPKYWGQQAWAGFGMGHSGVDFFFVLSGFIIAHVHFAQAGDVKSVPGYVRKRLVRIFPIYWVVLALTLIPLFLIPGLDPEASRKPLAVFASVILWPTDISPHVRVAWTLRHELLYYLLFALLIVNRRIGLVALAAWFVGCALWAVLGDESFPGDFLLSTYNLLFLMGMSAAWLLGRNTVAAPAWLASLGVALAAVTGFFDVTVGLSRAITLSYGIASTLAIIGFVELERSRKLVAPRGLTRLGDASYSFYLVHYALLSIGAKLLFALGMADLVPRPVTFVAVLSATCAGGLVFHRLVEKPLLGWLRPQRPPA